MLANKHDDVLFGNKTRNRQPCLLYFECVSNKIAQAIPKLA